MNNKLRKIIKLSRKYIEYPEGRTKHFTFIMKRNTVIAMGWNLTHKTHPIAHRFSHRFDSIHSELNALLNFPFPLSKLRDYNIINIRLRKDGTIGLAKPCKHCYNMLYAFGVKEMIYSINDNQFMHISLRV
jgi:tRNA(Arg) A34 adenosine deaminase TadA